MNKIKTACFAILLSTVFALVPAKADQKPITVFHFFVKGGSGPSGAFWKAANQYQEQNPDARLDFELSGTACLTAS